MKLVILKGVNTAQPCAVLKKLGYAVLDVDELFRKMSAEERYNRTRTNILVGGFKFRLEEHAYAREKVVMLANSVRNSRVKEFAAIGEKHNYEVKVVRT